MLSKVQENRKYLSRLDADQTEAVTDLLADWRLRARPKQQEPPGDWWILLLQTGRGFGKTRTLLELARARIDSGIWRTVLCAGPTWTDTMDTLVKGSTASPGLLGIWPSHRRPSVHLSRNDPHLVTWNKAKIRLRAAQSAERFRGPNNDGAVLDEIAAWKPDGMTPGEAFALCEMSVRTGDDPRILAATTPKRTRHVVELNERPDCHVVRGTMVENEANLSPAFIDAVRTRYEGTRLWRQEGLGELLTDVEDAILTHEQIRVARISDRPDDIERIVIGVDPAVTSGDSSDETGIVAVGRAGDHAYVIADRSCRLPPAGWAQRVVDLYRELDADLVIAEKNNGGEMVEHTLRTVDRSLPVRLVSASRGKHVRAEPVLALYEQGRIHHIGTAFEMLEEQLCAFTAEGYEGGASPDRADAGIWALTELLVARRGQSPSDLYGG